jgi:adenosylcobinamide-phosphate synthase
VGAVRLGGGAARRWLNLIPARLGGVVLCLAGGGGWAVLWRDHARHASPNAGGPRRPWPGLGLRLAGPVAYDGVVHAKDWIGDGRADANAQDVARALRLYRRACALLIALVIVFAWKGAAWAR